MSKYISRKFILAFVFTVTGCAVFAFTAKLSGGEFVALTGVILGAFTAGDAAINFIHRDKPNPDNPDEKET
jgi:hypothetical protein